jgi:RNase P/RNase MRP subunit p29
MATTTLTPPSDAPECPQRTDESSVFRVRADVFLSWLSETFNIELQTFIDDMNTLVVELNSDASDVTSAKELAEKWASEAEDVVVESGKYSAYHYAVKLSRAGVFTATSSTSQNIVSSGDLTFTLNEADRGYMPGSVIRIVDTNNPADNTMDGRVLTYSGNTLTVRINSSEGSGTAITDWSISLIVSGEADTIDGYSASELLEESTLNALMLGY